MKELFDLSFTPTNLVPTLLLGFVALYWLVFLFGLLDLSFLDVDLDKGLGLEAEIDLDAEVDVDADADGGSASGKSFAFRVLHFLNLGDVPLMVFMSFFALFFWAGSILGNHYLSDGGMGAAVGIGLGAALLGVLLTKLITQPFRKVFRSLNQAERALDLRGQICEIDTGTSGDRMGQAFLVIQGKHLLINVRSETKERLARGTRCVVLGVGPDQEYYYVQPLEIEA